MAAQVLSIPAHYENLVIKQQTVTTTQAALTPLVVVTDAIKKPENILVQALSTNTAPIYIGATGLTAGGAAIELAAGANINLPSNDFAWFVIATSGSQKLNIIYCSGAS